MYLNTYRQSPQGNYHISKLEAVCKERIRLYKILVQASVKKLEEGTTDWSNYVILQLKKLKLYTYCTLLGFEFNHGLLKAEIDDNIAHWIVGLCYCTTKKLRKFFVNWELQWFHLLYINTKDSERKMFLVKNNLMLDTIDVLEKLMYSDDLISCTKIDQHNFHDVKFFKVKFHEIPDIVRKREAYLENGTAVFSENNYFYYIKNKLQLEFLEKLKFQKKAIPNINTSIQYLINSIPKYVPCLYIGTEMEDITLETIDQINNDHFPLCMRHLHHVLKEEHHLKYDCRMQYGVFLFWLGLSYEDAVQLFREEFTQKMPETVFEKKYAYLFKHQYGLVGRKKPYAQYSCSKILSFSPSPMQHHGCPFKHWSKPTLLKTIENDVNCLKDIEDLIDQQQYQKACTKYFCSSKNIKERNIIESPNQYVIESFSVTDILERAFMDNG